MKLSSSFNAYHMANSNHENRYEIFLKNAILTQAFKTTHSLIELPDLYSYVFDSK
jgi:hypothetical protein